MKSMTIEEFYQWAKENGCTDYVINIECYDSGLTNWPNYWLDDMGKERAI